MNRVTDFTTVWDERCDKPGISLPGVTTYASLYEYIRFLATHLYDGFERDFAPGVQPFLSRVDQWVLGAPTDEDKQTLLESILTVRYVARDEVHSMYQLAYRGHLTRWLLDITDSPLNQQTDRSFDTLMRQVWIGSASDSFHLDTFFHLTNAPANTPRRPAWLELAAFGDPDRIAEHMADNGLKHILILEDFVGSGTQIQPAIQFALKIPGEPRILVCPMFACSDSFQTLLHEIEHERVTYDPVVTVPARNLLSRIQPPDEQPHLIALRRCLTNIHAKVDFPANNMHGIFGFQGVGSLIVQYSNTPDNCPPALWKDGEQWAALFPRKPREGDV